jgi:hypothetical protein
MSDEQTAKTPGEPARSERCACHEVLDHLGKAFDIPPAVREHLNNSRVEFLKAVRAVIDQRIERLSATRARGSKIAVE